MNLRRIFVSSRTTFFCYSVKDKINELLSKAHKGEAPRISLKDYILKACAIACTRTPATNSFFMGTFIRQNNNVDISIAFKTSSGDLIYPVLLDAHTKVRFRLPSQPDLYTMFVSGKPLRKYVLLKCYGNCPFSFFLKTTS